MKYHKFGQSDLVVSDVCSGFVCRGKQNSRAQAHRQLDCAKVPDETSGTEDTALVNQVLVGLKSRTLEDRT